MINIIVDQLTSNIIEHLDPRFNTIEFVSSNGINSNVLCAANELYGLIGNSDQKYVLICSSIGGYMGLAFAHKYPDKLLALILLDPSHPKQGISILETINSHSIKESADIIEVKKMCNASNDASISGAKYCESIKTLGSMNLLILIAGSIKLGDAIHGAILETITRNRHRMLIEYSQLSDQGMYKIVPGVGHAMAYEAPDITSRNINDYLYNIGGM